MILYQFLYAEYATDAEQKILDAQDAYWARRQQTQAAPHL